MLKPPPQLANPAVEHREDRVYLTYFTAGLRIRTSATRDSLRKSASACPQSRRDAFGPLPARVLTSQTEVVLVDARGYISITDKNQGRWVLRSQA